MTDAERYAITVRKVRIDDEEMWRATIRELPDVEEFADSRELAVTLVLDTIESLMADAIAEGQFFPEPMEDGDDEYSGRVTLRMPPYVHRAIAQRAQIDDMSLNSYIVATLTVDLAQRVKGLTAASDGTLTFGSAATVPAKFIEFAKGFSAWTPLTSLVAGAGAIYTGTKVVTSTNSAFYISGGQSGHGMADPNLALKCADFGKPRLQRQRAG